MRRRTGLGRGIEVGGDGGSKGRVRKKGKYIEEEKLKEHRRRRRRRRTTWSRMDCLTSSPPNGALVVRLGRQAGRQAREPLSCRRLTHSLSLLA